jgi:serine/threonine protein kinase
VMSENARETPCFELSAGALLAGKYRIEGVLGEGGIAVIWLATHLDLELPVAIKVVRSEYAMDEEVVARMLFEARTAAHLRSDHIVRVLDVGRLEADGGRDVGAPYIVMERLEGQDLGAYLSENGRLPVVLAVDCILQVCEALAEAHGAGLIHRDLKPENLFLAKAPEGSTRVKVLDFGISKDVRPDNGRKVLTNPSFTLGSPEYMAPEQMRAARDVDARVDIWSLGAIAFELISGVSPFEADSMPAVCARVLEHEPPRLRKLLPDVPRALEDAVARCLCKDKNRRYADVAALAKALAPWGSASARPQAARVSLVLANARERSTALAELAEERSDDAECQLDPSEIEVLVPRGPQSTLRPTTHTPSTIRFATTPASAQALAGVRRSSRARRAWLAAAVTGLAGIVIAMSFAARDWWAIPDETPVASAPLADRTWQSQDPALVHVQTTLAASIDPAGVAKAEQIELAESAASPKPQPRKLKPKKRASATDPWNPDNFGGRR